MVHFCIVLLLLLLPVSSLAHEGHVHEGEEVPEQTAETTKKTLQQEAVQNWASLKKAFHNPDASLDNFKGKVVSVSASHKQSLPGIQVYRVSDEYELYLVNAKPPSSETTSVTGVIQKINQSQKRIYLKPQ